ncbi:MAG: hypothetical protein KJ747_00765 [Actinobacteria bacterium]|nr:hypothetical protein [Actinomycetota bacterium]
MRSLKLTLAASLAFALLAAPLTGCAAQDADSGAMGMAAGGPTPGPGMGLGIVAADGDASLQVAEESSSAEGILVQRVVSPGAGWLVVRSLIEPYGVLGRVHIDAGESRDVLVTLDAADSAFARVALHADRGSRQVFEYDPLRPERSFDKPVFVDQVPVESDVAISNFGIEAPQNMASMVVKDQQLGPDGSLLVDYVRLPGPSWVAVHIMSDGVPGRLVGWVARGKGESFAFRVPLDGVQAGDRVMVTLHADTGEILQFEYDVSGPLGSIDQPYTASGIVVAKAVLLQ